MNAKEWQMVDAINAARAARGLPPLQGNDRLATAARGHADDIARHPGLEHTGSDGSDGGERIRRSGYAWTEWGEVVGWGWDGDVGPMVNWWLNSPEHARRILDTDMVDVGVGYVAAPDTEWGHYWTVNLARGDSGGYSEYLAAVVAGGW